jgi:hypothetical protein
VMVLSKKQLCWRQLVMVLKREAAVLAWACDGSKQETAVLASPCDGSKTRNSCTGVSLWWF